MIRANRGKTKMNLFDSETTILSFFRDSFKEEETAIFPCDGELPVLLEQITQDSQWNKWVNSSGKADPPPDFYCDEFSLMMEVMRVDDHAHKNHKGKVINPMNARESELHRELRKRGILERFPHVQVFCTPVTNLATKSDHNYTFYVMNFVRTVEEHKRKIIQYRENHPKSKLIFFIIDESSAYLQETNLSDISEPTFVACPMQGMPHQYWADETFIKAIINSNIDYLIWYTPFKRIQLQAGGILPLPMTCVFDIKRMSIQTQKYDANLMVSSEV